RGCGAVLPDQGAGTAGPRDLQPHQPRSGFDRRVQPDRQLHPARGAGNLLLMFTCRKLAITEDSLLPRQTLEGERSIMRKTLTGSFIAVLSLAGALGCNTPPPAPAPGAAPAAPAAPA